MATIRKIIERADINRPNAFSEEEKLRWIAYIEGKMALDVQLMDISEMYRFDYQYPDDLDKTLFVAFPHDDIYYYWLLAQIDKHNGEENRYQNSMEMYNSVLSDYLNWYISVYRPAQGDYKALTYYYTAYGIAVKQGFVGTVDEWLASLVGPKGEQGDPGAKLQIGTVQTLPAGAQAAASIGGTSLDPVLNLDIPMGAVAMLPLAGGIMQGAIDMGGNPLHNLAAPVADTDAATMQYVKGHSLMYKGTTQEQNPDGVKLESGLYQIVPAYPVHGFDNGLILQLQMVSGVAGLQMLVSDAGDVWLRVLWGGVYGKFRQLTFDYGTAADMPADVREGQLYLVEG